jgi:hypothetical protein
VVDLRKATPADLERFRECLAADPDHAGQDAEEWTAAPGELVVFYDEHENRVFVRLERVLRVSIQHDPATPKRAITEIIYKGFSWLQSSARSAGFTEVVFESRAERLIRFVKKLFGFEPIRENYYVRTVRGAEGHRRPTTEFLH